MAPELFRKSALARLDSPEQLDQLMEVTDTRGWWTLSALAALVVAALLWSVLGRISTTVQGTGILLREGGVFDVQTTAGGQVMELRVVEGQTVNAGDVIGRVAQPELVRQIAEAHHLGLVTGEQVEAVRGQLDASRGHFDNDLTSLRQVQVDIIGAQQASATNVRTVDNQLADAKRGLETLEGRLSQAERIISPQSGRVLEVKT